MSCIHIHAPNMDNLIIITDYTYIHFYFTSCTGVEYIAMATSNWIIQ